ncbi:MAG: hypothetical protein L0215_02035 [Gemmataceae bacterium]|nr:hypothetical protein [Gemmataceae bacterium]
MSSKPREAAMDQEPDISRRKGRETLLTLVLVAILGGAFIFFLNLATMGYAFHVLAALFGIAVVGFMHYVVWGYALSQQVAGEREEERLKEQSEARDAD